MERFLTPRPDRRESSRSTNRGGKPGDGKAGDGKAGGKPETPLLTPDRPCDTAYPAGKVVDVFSFTALGELSLIEHPAAPAGSTPAVLPRDLVHPRLMEEVYKAAFPGVPPGLKATAVKGGLPLHPKLENSPNPPVAPPYEFDRVTVKDFAEFVRERTLSLEGEEYAVTLTPSVIQDLLARAEAEVIATRDGEARLVKISLTARALPPALANGGRRTVRVRDPLSFLSEPVVEVAPGTPTAVTLSDRNVTELLETGSTELLPTEVGLPASAGSFYITSEFPTPDGPVTGPQDTAHWELLLQAIDVPDGGHDRPAYVPTTPPAADLDAAISKHVLPNFPFVISIPYHQTWEHLGYSRGEIVNTSPITIGPNGTTTVEVFTWDRLRKEREEATLVAREGTLEVAFTDKTSLETVKEAANDQKWKFNIGGGVTIPVKGVPVNVNAGYDASGGVRNLDRGTRQTVSDSIRKAAAKIQVSRQTKVVESRETGRETRVTQEVKNPNMCRTLTLEAREVRAHYNVSQVADVEAAALCILVPTSVTKVIDPGFVLAHEGVLSDALLAEVYREGFEAVRKLAAWENLCLRCMPACPCKPATPTAVTEPAGAVPGSETGTANDPVAAATADLTASIRALRAAIKKLESASYDQICGLANDLLRWGAYEIGKATPFGMSDEEITQYENEWAAAAPQWRQYLYREAAMETLAPRFWEAARQFATETDESPQRLERFLLAATPQIIDIFNAATLSTRAGIKSVEVLVETFLCVNKVPLITNAGFDDAGFDAAFQQAKRLFDAYQSVIATPALPAQPQSAEEQRKEVEQVLEKATLPYEEKEIAEARVSQQALLSHLQINQSYYREAVWRSLDPSDRRQFLELFGDLLAYVDNEVLGFVGDKAVMPVRLGDHPELEEWFEQNVRSDPALAVPSAPEEVIVPTKGVILESRLGECDACEPFITRHRELDLEQKQAEVKAAEEKVSQEELETQRYEKRLATKPKPLLDDPDPNAVEPTFRILVDRQDDSAPPLR